jgi:hypothetical protein
MTAFVVPLESKSICICLPDENSNTWHKCGEWSCYRWNTFLSHGPALPDGNDRFRILCISTFKLPLSTSVRLDSEFTCVTVSSLGSKSIYSVSPRNRANSFPCATRRRETLRVQGWTTGCPGFEALPPQVQRYHDTATDTVTALVDSDIRVLPGSRGAP